MRSSRKLPVLAVMVVLAAGVAWARPQTSFVFKVPPGWTDLTPGVPESNYAGVQPEVVAQIKKSAPLFFAADVAGSRGRGHGGFMTNVNGSVVAGSSAITDEVLDGYVADVRASGARYEVKDRELDDWNGVTVGILVGELTVASRAVAQVAYVIPGDGERAFLTFSTTPAELAGYRQTFDEAARATQGAVQPTSFLEKSGVRGTILAFLGAALLLLLVHRRRRSGSARAGPRSTAP